MKPFFMKLSVPFLIGPRLAPALHIGGAWVYLEYSRTPGREGRTRYTWTIDLPSGKSHTASDLQSGAQSGSLQDGFGSLLSFLSACAEGAAYARRTGRASESADLFPTDVAAWADDNSDVIECLAFDIQGAEETGAVLIDERAGVR